MRDEAYMELAIELAEKGRGEVSPNPLVGAVLVKDKKIIGRGYHASYGALHAERQALLDCERLGHSSIGATMYVTLEPCCHYGKQPPCTQALLDAGVKRVVVGSADPNPMVAGKGLKDLRVAGVEVVEGFLREKCDALNPVFFHYMTKKKPYVAVKYAMTLDGKIATKAGNSKWITGEPARNYVHKLRSLYDGIVVGVGTVLADNPLLTAHGAGRNPMRIVCDTNLRTPLESQLVKTAHKYKTIIVTTSFDAEKIKRFKTKACEVWVLSKKAGRVNLVELMDRLAKLKISSLFVEGGGNLIYSFFAENLVQKVYAFIAPKIFGGAEAKTPVEGKGIKEVQEAFCFEKACLKKLGKDFLFETEVGK
ncbi:MAG: bifunctional diaminohydroxyphosphoribosylaminopyrimidine deaminase/5-amino-6-(5-phosphoribosylamino)uracil reductase RibD [Treponemataceae bacterium]